MTKKIAPVTIQDYNLETVIFYPLLYGKADVDSAKTVRSVLYRILKFLHTDIVVNSFFLSNTALGKHGAVTLL